MVDFPFPYPVSGENTPNSSNSGGAGEVPATPEVPEVREPSAPHVWRQGVPEIVDQFQDFLNEATLTPEEAGRITDHGDEFLNALERSKVLFAKFRMLIAERELNREKIEIDRLEKEKNQLQEKADRIQRWINAQ